MIINNKLISKLEKINKLKILYLTQDDKPRGCLNDYQCDLLLHGLRSLLGDNVIDYPGSWHLYKDESKKRNLSKDQLWGKGFSQTDTMDNFDSIDREDILSKINNKYFDLVIYGSARRSLLFFEEILKNNIKIIFIDGQDLQDIDKKLLKYGLYFKKEYIHKNIDKKIFPIHFAIPESKIIKEPNPNPSNVLAPMIPGKKDTYIYENEKEYYKMYQDSIFALTIKKACWDVFRHYEILANGCIPLFLDVKKVPELTLTNLPKDKIYDIFNKYEFILNNHHPKKIYNKKFLIYKNYFKYIYNVKFKKIYKRTLFSKIEDIRETQNYLLDYTRKNLTTVKLAEYLINIFKINR